MTDRSHSPDPSEAFLQALIHKGMRRGIPVQEAEDLVMESWERARAAFDPSRGSFEALFLRISENAFRYWWRRETRARKVADRLGIERDGLSPPPRLVKPAPVRAAALQQRLLSALDPDERDLFFTWALSYHLPRGQFSAAEAARSLGMSPGVYDHARRALKVRIDSLLGEWGVERRELLGLETDEGTADVPRRRRR